MFCICPEHMNEVLMFAAAAFPALGVAIAWVRSRLSVRRLVGHQHGPSCSHGEK